MLTISIDTAKGVHQFDWDATAEEFHRLCDRMEELAADVGQDPADIASASGAENAEGYYREALALAEPRGMRPLVAHCHLGLGKLRRRAGDREQALEDLTTALAMYRDMGMTYWLAQVEAELRQLG